MSFPLMNQFIAKCKGKKVITAGFVLPEYSGDYAEVLRGFESFSDQPRPIIFYFYPYFYRNKTFGDLSGYIKELIDNKYDVMFSIGMHIGPYIRLCLREHGSNLVHFDLSNPNGEHCFEQYREVDK